MSKEAILMVVDAGNSMDEMYTDDVSRLSLAMQCIIITVQQKIFHNSAHEVGLALFGDNDAPDGNYNSLQNISKCDN
jgi:hypothetical protein